MKVSATDGLTKPAAVKVTGVEAGAKWEYRLNTNDAWTIGSDLPNNAGPGFVLGTENTYAQGAVQVRQTDTVGNVSAITSSSKAWTIDNTPPIVSISSDKAHLKVGETATLTLSFSEASMQKPIISAMMGSTSADSISAWTVDGSDPQKFTAIFTPAVDLEGEVVFSIGAWQDDAGNLGQSGTLATIALDTLPPPAPPTVVHRYGTWHH